MRYAIQVRKLDKQTHAIRVMNMDYQDRDGEEFGVNTWFITNYETENPDLSKHITELKADFESQARPADDPIEWVEFYAPKKGGEK